MTWWVSLRSAALAAGFYATFFAPLAQAQTPRRVGVDDVNAEVAEVDLLQGMRSGDLAVEAQGSGSGRMTVSVTNRTDRPLRVVLPAGLIASGASGQFGGGGMGGMGGGGMGGGMGGMGGGGMGGGGMGGGGMGGGGMGGGGGGMGGGLGGQGAMGTLDPMSGMMMLGQLIMQLTGERDSWDFASLFSGGMMGGGMGGGGMMGGMGGGGMGGMGGGGMGGMGGGGMGGFRSVPPTGPARSTLQPGQTRRLPTPVVSLNGPGATAMPILPAKGESLQLGDVSELSGNPRLSAAVERLAQEKAPETVAQLVLWNVAAGMDWTTIERLSRRWANPSEVALARGFVSRLAAVQPGDQVEESGVFYIDISTKAAEYESLSAQLSSLLEKVGMLGLKVQLGIPDRPVGPSLACRLTLSDQGEAVASLGSTDGKSAAWLSTGKFSIPVESDRLKDFTPAEGQPALTDEQKLELRAGLLADSLAEGILSRLVRAQLTKGPKVQGKDTYRIRLDNVSPMVLNGIALTGPTAKPDARPAALSAMSLPPRKSFVLPASADAVDRLGFKDGVRAIAADLSAL